MAWVLRIPKSAQKELDGLRPRDREAVMEALRRLIIEPGAVDIKKLAGCDEWRLRVGRYRVRFTFDPQTKTISVMHVLSRDRAYRR